MSIIDYRSKPGILAWLLLIFTIHLCANKADSWTVLVYMAGDNNLSEAAIQNINDMEAAALPANLKLVVQSDLPLDSAYPGGQRRLIKADDSPHISSPLIQDLGQINSGHPRTLYDFARWGFKRYPSDKRALIIWGHGNSWFKGDAQKWICPDDGAQSLISVYDGQLQSALKGLPHIDILILDACSMQSVEVLTELKDVADYVIASEDEVPSKGFPYQEMMVFFDGSLLPEAISIQIVDAFIDSYDAYGSQNPEPYSLAVTCSAAKMHVYDSFLQELQSFSLRYRYHAEELLALRDGCYEMNHGFCDVDIYEYFAKVAMESSNLDLQTGARAVLAALDSVIIHKRNLGHAENVGAAALWFPWHWQYFEGLWMRYIKLDFAQYRWINLLYNAFMDSRFMPNQPLLLSYKPSLGSVLIQLNLQDYPDDTFLHASVEYEDETIEYEYDIAWMQKQISIRIPLKEDAKIRIVRKDLLGYQSSALELELIAPQVGLSMEIHPNPVQNKSRATLRWNVPKNLSGNAKLELYNLRGQKMGSYELGVVGDLEGSLAFSAWPLLTKIPAGTYLLRLKFKDKECGTKLTIL